MLHQSRLPQSFWAEAVLCANHTINLSPQLTLQNLIPLKEWNSISLVSPEKVLDYSTLIPFGCAAFYNIPRQERVKLDWHSAPAIMVGYEPHSKSYCLWDTVHNSIVVWHDVVFNENLFPRQPLPATPTPLAPDDSELVPNHQEYISLEDMDKHIPELENTPVTAHPLFHPCCTPAVQS